MCLVLCSGQDPAAPSPTEAATNTKHTSDLLRRFKELRVREAKDPSGLDQPEIDLKVSHRFGPCVWLTSLCCVWHLWTPKTSVARNTLSGSVLKQCVVVAPLGMERSFQHQNS